MEDRENNEDRFGALRSLGKLISTLGWIAVAGGGLVFFLGLAAAGGGGRRGAGGLEMILALGPGLLVSLFGMLIVAAGQTISCFVAIEHNTRATWSAQKAILTALRENEPLPAAASREPEPSPRRMTVPPPAPPAGKPVTCPKCAETETVANRYDVSQYHKFGALDKSSLGFQSVSLTCRKCGTVFRI